MGASTIKEMKIKIKTDHVDFKKKLKISKLLEFFQDIASDHAYEMGLGFEELNKRNLMWVLVKVKIEINKMPSVNDEVVLKTWPLESKMLLFEREFQLFDKNGDELLKATSVWCILNQETRVMVRAKEIVANMEKYETVKVIEEKLGKIKLSENILDNYAIDKIIRYSDMDQNVHFNNSKFADIAMDCFDFDFLKDNSIKSIYINFLNEGKYADKIQAYCEKDEDQYRILGVNTTKNNNLFESVIEFN